MTDHFDHLETRSPDERQADLFGRLPGTLSKAMEKAPGWAKHLAGTDPTAITGPSELAALPIFRKADLLTLQRETPPFGGLTTNQAGNLRRLFMSPGPIFDPEGHGDDWWGVGRTLFAGGLRAGDIVHNTFSYHLTPAGLMFETGAAAVGCAVIPAGTGNTQMQFDLIEHYRPVGYAGTPDYLKVLLDKADEAGRDASSIRRGVVGGAALPGSLRAELADRGVGVLQTYGTADLGMIAYESAAMEGMILSEGLILEIVRPGSGDPVADGEVGEVVVTRLNPDYPLIRFATGDLSAILPGQSPCGRTNTRIKGWMGRADQRTKVKGMFVDPSNISDLLKRHREITKARLVVDRLNEQDRMTLKIEADPSCDITAVEATLRAVTKLRGAVELAAEGTLPNDGKVIADERDYD